MPIVQLEIGPRGEFVVEETEVTRHVALGETAGGFTLPGPPSGSDRHFQQVHAPGLRAGSRPVILFRTRHEKTPRFSLRLNSTTLMQHAFVKDDTRHHSWHEIVPAGALKPQDNELVFAVAGDGSVTFGDVVILYTSNELTVKRPLTLSPS
jgi:hypothetical protein